MASVTGVTAEQAALIEASSVISAFLSPSGDLILVMAGGTQINAGPIAAGYSTVELRESITTLKSFDTPKQDVVVQDWFAGVANEQVGLNDPLPGNCQDVSWSPDGRYVAFAHFVSPYISIYKLEPGNPNRFLRVSNPPAVILTSSASCISWSPDGQYLAIGSILASVPIIIYKRAGDVFTKIADLPSMPIQVTEISWSPDGTYLSLGVGTGPYYAVYKRAGGDTFTKLTVPNLGTLSAVNEIAWSNSGQYMVLGTLGFDFLILKRSGDTFTKLPDPTFISEGTVRGVCFSPNDQYMVVTAGPFGSNGLYIYKRNVDVFTKLPDPVVMPPLNDAMGACWSPDGKYLVVTSGTNNTPYLTIYSRDNDTFTSITPLPTGVINGSHTPAFSPDGRYLVVCSTLTPFYSLHRSARKPPPGYQISTTLVP